MSSEVADVSEETSHMSSIHGTGCSLDFQTLSGAAARSQVDNWVRFPLAGRGVRVHRTPFVQTLIPTNTRISHFRCWETNI